MFVLEFFKSIIIGIIIFILILEVMFFDNFNFQKEDIINAYESIIKSLDFVGLSKDKELNGKRIFGIDKYVGTYQAKYDNQTSEETIFGGTVLNRKNGDHVKLKIDIEKENGDISVIAKLGNSEIKLIDDTGKYEDSIYIEGTSYYLNVKLNKFTGNINIISE